MVTPEVIAIGTHMTADTVKKYLAVLADKGLINEDGTPTLKCEAGQFFTLPNEIFLLNLPPSAFMIYAYLLLIEDRRTHTGHPSYNTIAAATGLSKNTALKSVCVLLETGLISVEATRYFDKRSMKWKGNNLDNCSTQNEYIEKAIRFYSGYLDAEQADSYLPCVLSDVLEGKLSALGSRIGKLLFKLSVDNAVMSNLVAFSIDVDLDTLKKVRVGCIKEVTRLQSGHSSTH